MNERRNEKQLARLEREVRLIFKLLRLEGRAIEELEEEIRNPKAFLATAGISVKEQAL